MIQCQLPPAGKPFDQSTNSTASTEGAGGDIEASGKDLRASLSSAGIGAMGADRRLSNLVGSNFMESATSIFKVYIRDSLSGDDSSNSNVAIDNKIEQAMDLVKSHLMFAVREEVEILKEQIKELLAKNSQLEYENKILRADATDETLAKLKSNTIM